MDLDIETIQPEEYPDALILKERANVFLTDAFKEGLFEVQDASSQLVAPFLGVQPGMRVVDTCAGAGGKSSKRSIHLFRNFNPQFVKMLKIGITMNRLCVHNYPIHIKNNCT